MASLAGQAVAGESYAKMKDGTEYVDGMLMVRYRDDVSPMARNAINQRFGAELAHQYRFIPGLQAIRLAPGTDLDAAIAAYQQDPNVLYAERNVVFRASAIPNDPMFPQLWGMNQASDADINAPEAWDLTTGSSSVVVIVTDTGVDYTHEDLAANIWTNPGEIAGNGVDDDGNGYVDDVHGINAITGTGNPMDDNDHGSHCSGTIGGVGNNAKGVAGVNWNVRIGACKFLSAGGSGTLADAEECFDYIHGLKTRASNPVPVVASSNSWGCGSAACNTAGMRDGISMHDAAGMLFIAAAGNAGANNDVSQSWPSNYYLPNMVSVAASTETDTKASFSSYGRRSVHLAAPGTNIVSTTIGNTYSSFSGTSMATPHVAGSAALIKARMPNLSHYQLRNLLISSGTPLPGFTGPTNATISGRRLRLWDSAGGLGALTCTNSIVNSRLQPKTVSGTVQTVVTGTPVPMAVYHVNCENPAGTTTVTVTSATGTTTVTLLDDGLNGDLAAGDGVYTGEFIPTAAGQYTMDFGGGDTLIVIALDVYRAATRPTPVYETITGFRIGGADDAVITVTTPFPIKFANHAAGFTTLRVDTNGRMSFDSALSSAFGNAALPVAAAGTLVAPLWDDLLQGALPQGIFTETTGTAPNQHFVVEYRTGLFSGTCSPNALFQVVFFENSSDIQFNYQNIAGCGAGGGATVGVQVSGTVAQQFSFNQSVLTDGLTLLWRTSSPPLAGRPVVGPGTWNEGDLVPITASFTDGDGPADSPWTAQWDLNYNGTTFTPDVSQTYTAEGPVALTQAFADSGNFNIGLRVLDKDSSPSGVRSGTIVVNNLVPTISALAVTSPSVLEGTTTSFQATFADPGIGDAPWRVEWDFDYDGTTFRPDFSASASNLGDVSASKLYTEDGTQKVAIRVTDKDGGQSVVRVLDIDVLDVSPVITAQVGNPGTGSEPVNVQLSVTAATGAADGTSDPVAFYFWDGDGDGSEDSVTLTPTTLVRYVDNPAGGSVYNARVRVQDEDSSTTVTIPVTVNNVAPTVQAVSDKTASEGSRLQLRVLASDPAGANDPLSYALIAAPAGMEITSDGSLSWIPDALQATQPGTAYPVTVEVTDDDGAASQVSFNVTANNVAPTLTASPASATLDEGSGFVFQVRATDPGGPYVLSYDLQGAPAGMAITSAGYLTWRVTAALATAAPGTPYAVTVRAIDDDGAVASQTFTLTARNVAPALAAITGGPVTEGLLYQLQIPASDPGGEQVLTYSLANAPAGMTVSGSGLLTWLPAFNQCRIFPGSSYTVDVTVTDDDGATATQAFTLSASWKDGDNDRMADSWEAQNGMDPTRDDSLEDADRDCALNVDEFNHANGGARIPGLPAVVGPVNDQFINAKDPVISLTNAIYDGTDGAAISYVVELYADQALTQRLVNAAAAQDASGTTQVTVDDTTLEGGGDDNDTANPNDADLADDTLYWYRARAVAGTRSGTCTTGSVRVFYNPVNDAPSKPTLAFPLNGQSVSLTRPRLVIDNSMDVDAVLPGTTGGVTGINYRFEIAQDAAFTSMVAASPAVAEGGFGSTGWVVTADLAENATYYWRVTATDRGDATAVSDPGTFRVNLGNNEPTIPELVSPALGEVVRANSATLVVKNSLDPDGDALTYFFEIDTSPTFNSPDHVTSAPVAQGTGANTQYLTPSTLQEDKVHFWRARASDGFTTGDWFVGNFKVNAINGAPGVPVLLNPRDGSLLTSQTPSFTVLDAEDPEGEAVTYDFEVHKETPEGEVVASASAVTAGAGQTSFAAQTQLERGKPYYWRARAVDVNGLAGEWSAPALFQIQGGCGCSFAGAGGLLPMAMLALGLLRLRRRK